jgi:hypothetical protein
MTCARKSIGAAHWPKPHPILPTRGILTHAAADFDAEAKATDAAEAPMALTATADPSESAI